MKQTSRLVLLDRDGVLNLFAVDGRRGLPRPPYGDELVCPPAVLTGLRRLSAAGYHLAVVTNQPDLAKGTRTTAELDATAAALTERLAAHGIELSAVYECRHHPQAAAPGLAVDCDCRKPASGMLLRAMPTWGRHRPPRSWWGTA